jgi:hypothetical protein
MLASCATKCFNLQLIRRALRAIFCCLIKPSASHPTFPNIARHTQRLQFVIKPQPVQCVRYAPSPSWISHIQGISGVFFYLWNLVQLLLCRRTCTSSNYHGVYCCIQISPDRERKLHFPALDAKSERASLIKRSALTTTSCVSTLSVYVYA